jgi:hypothetical protein
MPDSMRTDRVKAVFGGTKHGTRSVVYIDPVTPDHWKTNRELYTMINQIREKFDVIIVAGEGRTFLPSPETEAQIIEERRSGALTGTDQQIAWAIEIRSVLRASQQEWASTLEPMEVPADQEPQKQEAFSKILKAGDRLRSETSAQWFIEHRGMIAGSVLTDRNRISAKNAVVRIATEEL